ncbi:MAG: TIGR03943 family protein [Candidatus Omnitrophica bacterium]|nr:TIGR03943 family protein [Candidatus Omnitrophota bacterium]
MFKKKNFYQTLTIFIWLLFLFVIQSSGKLKLFIKKDYIPFTILGSFILLILFLIRLKRYRKEVSGDIDFMSALSFLAFLFPVLLTTIVRPGNLSSFAAMKRGITGELAAGETDVLEIMKAQLETEGEYRKLNVKQFLALAKKRPDEIAGKPLCIEGLVFKQNGRADRFILVRFLITCCAADATPLGIEVESSLAGQLQKDIWVKVYGRGNLGQDKPQIIAEDIKEVPKPADLYLY